AGGRYLSSDQPMRAFAAGTATNQLTVEVIWRSGRQTVVEHVPANSYLEVKEKGAIPTKIIPKAERPPLFADVSSLLNHRHHENNFDEFHRQPLLPKMLSQLGPGVAWFDLDGDGHDDLVIGSAQGGSLAVFRSQGNGIFAPIVD